MTLYHMLRSKAQTEAQAAEVDNSDREKFHQDILQSQQKIKI